MSVSISKKVQIWKTVSWSMISMVTTTFVGWYVIGWYLPKAFTIGLMVGIADRIVKTILYYIHERVWHRVYKSWKQEAVK